MITRFDSALAKKTTKTMAECARIMAMFDREKHLVQRYVSAQPVFAEDSQAYAVHAPTGPSDAEIQLCLQPVRELYAALLAMVQGEVGGGEQDAVH